MSLSELLRTTTIVVNRDDLHISSEDENTTIIYVLKCGDVINPMYYVGETNDIRKMIFNPKVRSKWTDLYKPLNIVKIYNKTSIENISKTSVVLHCMKLYGSNKVRGGGYCSVILSESSIRNLNYLLDEIGTNISIENVIKSYEHLLKIHKQIFKCMKYQSLDYGQMIDRDFVELSKNEDFLKLDTHMMLTRSVKKRAVPNVKFNIDDNIGCRKKFKK